MTQASSALVGKAVSGTLMAKKHWEMVSWDVKAGYFLRAADLVSDKYRHKLVAAIMRGQGKTVRQADRDAAEVRPDLNS